MQLLSQSDGPKQTVIQLSRNYLLLAVAKIGDDDDDDDNNNN
jgi:hypothetical protein